VELIQGGAHEQEAPRAPSPEPAAAPVPEPPQSKGRTALALYDYEATEENELTFPDGAIIENLQFPDEDWWQGTYNGHEGLFVSFPLPPCYERVVGTDTVCNSLQIMSSCGIRSG
jgi:hypothetical protein